jgi:hypothetical protein
MREGTSVKLQDELNWFFVIMFETQRELGCSKSYSFFLFNFLLLKRLQGYFIHSTFYFLVRLLYLKPNPNLPLLLKPDMNPYKRNSV